MGRTDRAEIFAEAPPGSVWAALTDPAEVAAWLPPDGMTAHVGAWEARPGGRLSVVLSHRDPKAGAGKSGAGTDAVEGRFTEVEPLRRLAWVTLFDSPDPSFGGQMSMVWTLSPDGTGTRIVLEARDVPPGIRPEDHAAGMGASLRQLAMAAVRR